MILYRCAFNSETQVVLNYLGIGNGRLLRTAVLSILQQLSDAITI